MVASVMTMGVGLVQPVNLEAQTTGGGSSYSAAGFEFPCTRIWCQSTWSMSACGLGEVTSQVCNTSASQRFRVV
ncbi:hypothetical protein MM213_04565 [Belliella sp. R4-6]|uniref:Secreted protein n=1 Tax=Belliella alkalica TaxID=1730871 RepID=A0ABS9V8J6_9BACT|nr:hypothetical protein [Belliella alkalica]MCH7412747.1 hypothetical protein [Belliella alkalica]